MCAIAGLAGPLAGLLWAAEGERVLRVLSPRGPDSEGVHVDRHIALGIRRLSINDSVGGGQPMYSDDGRVVLIANAEIYNHSVLRRHLEKRGYIIKSGSDCEVMVHLYREYGIELVNKLNGPFAFALLDRVAGELWLARDRLGEKPLFYSRTPIGVAFASELKALVAGGFVRPRLNEQALMEYLKYQYAPEPETLLRTVYHLPAGHYAKIDLSSGRMRMHVQPHSGTAANMAAYRAVMAPGQTLLTLSMLSGGHLSHGHPKHVSSSTYNVAHYELDPVTLQLNYADIRKQALASKPAAIVAGYSAYPRQIDFAAFAKIADEVDAVLIADISHVAGLVATGLYPNPCGVGALVTLSVEKTLRGTRGGVILCPTRLADAVDTAVFPGLQSSIGMAGLVSLCALLNEVVSSEYIEYHRRTLSYAHLMAESLMAEGLRIVSGGTDTHLLLIDLTDQGLTGREAEGRLASIGILSNRNLVPGDRRKAFVTSGLRLGTATIAARGWTAGDVHELSEIVASTLLATKWPNSEGRLWRDRVRALTSRRRDNDSLADLVDGRSTSGSAK